MDYRLKTTQFSLKVSLPSGVFQPADCWQFSKPAKASFSPVCPCPPAPLPAPSGNSIPSLTLHLCFPKHTRVTHLLSNYSSVCEPAGGRGRNTAAGRFVCGRCKTAQVIFNWLPVIVSLLGTRIVPSFFRNPTHLALRQVKTNTDANIWPQFAPNSFYTIVPPFSYVLHSNHCPTDGSDLIFGFCSVIKKLWGENNIRSDSQLVSLSPGESQFVWQRQYGCRRAEILVWNRQWRPLWRKKRCWRSILKPHAFIRSTFSLFLILWFIPELLQS